MPSAGQIRSFANRIQIRDSITVVRDREAMDIEGDRWAQSVLLRIRYHFTIDTNTTDGQMANFFIVGRQKDPVIKVGKKNVKYSGNFFIDEVEVIDNLDGTSRVNCMIEKQSDMTEVVGSDINFYSSKASIYEALGSPGEAPPDVVEGRVYVDDDDLQSGE